VKTASDAFMVRGRFARKDSPFRSPDGRFRSNTA